MEEIGTAERVKAALAMVLVLLMMGIAGGIERGTIQLPW